MKKMLLSVVVIVSLGLINSCKQDFDITGEYKEIPVVYGLLNSQDNTHYIRIQKGYLIDGNAKVAAGVPDSIYYPDVLTVKLIPYLNGSPNGSPFTLNRVNGDDIGLPKESGVFAGSPNILYTFNGALNNAREYRLEVTNNSNGYTFFNRKDEDSLNIRLVKDFRVATPTKGAKINLQNNNAARVVWEPAENAGIYDMKLVFFYKEFESNSNTLLKDTFIEIPFITSLTAEYQGNNVVVELPSDQILTYLARNLETSQTVYREFNVQKGIQVKIAVGGTELTKYINSLQAQSGLSSNEALSPYTNISNGVGILSSRYFKQVDSVLLSNTALDSLSCSELSKSLRFKNHSGQICN